jgi:hypothetical protein
MTDTGAGILLVLFEVKYIFLLIFCIPLTLEQKIGYNKNRQCLFMYFSGLTVQEEPWSP